MARNSRPASSLGNARTRTTGHGSIRVYLESNRTRPNQSFLPRGITPMYQIHLHFYPHRKLSQEDNYKVLKLLEADWNQTETLFTEMCQKHNIPLTKIQAHNWLIHMKYNQSSRTVALYRKQLQNVPWFKTGQRSKAP